jgi:hypothetical protein
MEWFFYIIPLLTRITTVKRDTSSRFGVTDVDSDHLSDLCSLPNDTKHAGTEETIEQKVEHQESPLSTSAYYEVPAPARSKRKIASAILASTIAMAANIAQNPGVHQDIQSIGSIFITIIETLKVSGVFYYCFFYSCMPFVATESW